MKKFVEEEFPISELSKLGSHEKSVRADNISGVHVWWARRPSTVCRGLILSCLFDYPETKEKRKEISDFIIFACSDFKKLPNLLAFKQKLNDISTNKSINEKIKLLDTFSGGGSIPLEGARLGLESFGIDLNPVAVLIGKATCEFLQKYNFSLIIEVKKWWKSLESRLKKQLQRFYYNPINDRAILSYIWARQIKCINHKCNAVIPMLLDLKLSNKKDKKVVIKPIIKKNDNGNKITFIIQENSQIDFKPDENKIFSQGKITCPACGTTILNKDVMKKVKEKNYDDILLIIVEKEAENVKRIYRLATKEDLELFGEVKIKLKEFEHLFPKEKLAEKVRRWQVQNYGILEWKEFFNDRQMLLYLLFSEEIKNIYKKVKESYDNPDFIKGIMLYLSFILSRSVTHNSKFTHWRTRNESIAQTWSRSGIFMKGNYPEQNPFVNFTGTPIRYLNFMENIAKKNLNFSNIAHIKQGNAMNLEFEDESIDLIITDPPYYDAMLYADPSDFFYIWLKKTLEDIFPDLFLFSLTPKDEEIIQSRFRHNESKEKAKRFYDKSLGLVLKQFYRVLKKDGIGIIMYTHKSVVAWEILIKAIIESDLTISAAWPIETETKGGIRSLNRVVLASSIAIVFKKRKKEKEIYFETQFSNIIEDELRKKLKSLLIDLEIYGADFFISAIGFSLKIFTRYKNVISQKTGDQVPVSKFLDLVRKIVNDFLLSTVLERSVTQSIDEITNLYIIWCWFFRNNGIDLDDALKLAQSFGVGELDFLRKNKLIKLDNKKFKLLLASDKVRENHLIKNKDRLTTLIDNLHLLAILWKNNDKNLDEEVKKVEIEYSENIWKVGQALAEFFPNKHNEHNCLQGLLARYGKAKPKSDLKKWS